MSFKAFLKKCMMQYFIITTCVTAATAILGLLIDRTAKFGYEGYFSPLIFGFLGTAPSLVMYSRKELSFRQMLLRKILHFVLLESTLILFGVWNGLLPGFSDALSFALTVFVVYLAVNLISWRLDQKEADDINKSLKMIQGR